MFLESEIARRSRRVCDAILDERERVATMKLQQCVSRFQDFLEHTHAFHGHMGQLRQMTKAQECGRRLELNSDRAMHAMQSADCNKSACYSPDTL